MTPKGIVKLAVTMGDHPQMLTVVTKIPRRRLSVSLQQSNREATPESLEGGGFNLLPNNEVSHRN